MSKIKLIFGIFIDKFNASRIRFVDCQRVHTSINLANFQIEKGSLTSYKCHTT